VKGVWERKEAKHIDVLERQKEVKKIWEVIKNILRKKRNLCESTRIVKIFL
jgi:hypothetical protein